MSDQSKEQNKSLEPDASKRHGHFSKPSPVIWPYLNTLLAHVAENSRIDPGFAASEVPGGGNGLRRSLFPHP